MASDPGQAATCTSQQGKVNAKIAVQYEHLFIYIYWFLLQNICKGIFYHLVHA